MSYDNTNTGVLFGNLDSSEPKEDRRPNFDGTLNIEGVEYKIAGWVRIGKEGGKMAGRKFLSLKAEPMAARTKAAREQIKYDWKTAENATKSPVDKVPPITGNEFDDNIPF